MHTIFSPSKKQSTQQIVDFTEPAYLQQAELLHKKLKSLSVEGLVERFKVSESIVQQLHQNYQNNEEKGNALASFSGTSFSRLDIKNYSPEDWNFAQKHISVLSGLYGVLKLQDAISSYRLDFADNISWMNLDKNLYQYWGELVNKQLLDKKVILGLASEEYIKILSPENLEKLIRVNFLVKKKDTYKSVSVFSKQQRGSMLDYIIKNKIADPEQLKSYESDGFVFDEKQSHSKVLTFVKS